MVPVSVRPMDYKVSTAVPSQELSPQSHDHKSNALPSESAQQHAVCIPKYVYLKSKI